jgi:hypothetical protein
MIAGHLRTRHRVQKIIYSFSTELSPISEARKKHVWSTFLVFLVLFRAGERTVCVYCVCTNWEQLNNVFNNWTFVYYGFWFLIFIRSKLRKSQVQENQRWGVKSASKGDWIAWKKSLTIFCPNYAQEFGLRSKPLSVKHNCLRSNLYFF